MLEQQRSYGTLIRSSELFRGWGINGDKFRRGRGNIEIYYIFVTKMKLTNSKNIKGINQRNKGVNFLDFYQHSVYRKSHQYY